VPCLAEGPEGTDLTGCAKVRCRYRRESTRGCSSSTATLVAASSSPSWPSGCVTRLRGGASTCTDRLTAAASHRADLSESDYRTPRKRVPRCRAAARGSRARLRGVGRRRIGPGPPKRPVDGRAGDARPRRSAEGGRPSRRAWREVQASRARHRGDRRGAETDRKRPPRRSPAAVRRRRFAHPPAGLTARRDRPRGGGARAS